MTDELERLARRGRELDDAEKARRDEDEAQKGGDAERAAVRNRGRSVSAFAGWGWIALGIPLGIALAFVTAPSLPPSWSHADAESDPASAALCAVATIPLAFFWLARPFFASLAVAREEARIRALPFPLVGLLETLGRDPRDATVQITITFAGAAPEAELVHDVFRTIGAEPRTSTDPRKRSVARNFTFESSVSTNAFIANWMRRAVPILVALHARHPITQARVEAS